MAIPLGGQNFLKALYESDTSTGKALKYGIDQPTENFATTLGALGYDEAAGGLRSLVEGPENYESAAARFMNPGEPWYDFNWKDFPLAAVEQSGQLAGSMALRFAGAGVGTLAGSPILGAILAFGGPALFEAVQIAGPVALDRARNNGREEPNGADWAGAMGTAAFSGVLNAIGVKGIPGLNAALGTTGKTIAQTLGAGLREGVTEFGQGVTEQVGGTAFTDKGLTIDPKQALGEGLIGTGIGMVTTAPAAAIQAVNSMGQTPPTTPDAAVEAMGPFPPTTPDAAVETMGATQQFQEGLQQYEQEVPPPDPLDEQNVQADQSDRDAFIETQENYIEAFINNENERIRETSPGLYFDRATRANILMDVQDRIRSDFEFFDSRLPENTPDQIRQNLDEIIASEVQKRERAEGIDTTTVGELDLRFDTPNRTIQNVYADKVLRGGELGPKVPPWATARAGITSIETGIDPVFMTQSVILGNDPEAPLGVLNNLPPTMTAADAMQKLGIKEVGNWFEPSNQKMVPIANEAINTEVASFLKARKEQGKTVTREEIRDVMHDSISRHTTETRQGAGTRHNGGHTYSDLDDIFPGLDYARDSVEKWSQYDARLPKGENAGDSLYYHQVDDTMHSPHGPGANMWWRGFNVNDPMGEGEGILLAENQSNLHGHSQSKKYDDIYLSDYKAAQKGKGSEKIENTRGKISRFESAEERLLSHLRNLQNDAAGITPTAVAIPAFVSSIALLARNSPTGPYVAMKNYRVSGVLDSQLSLISPEYKQKREVLDSNMKELAETRAFREIAAADPFGRLGEEVTLSELQEARARHPEIALAEEIVFQELLDRGVDVRALALTETGFRDAISEVTSARAEAELHQENAFESPRAELAAKYLPLLAAKYPPINDLLIQGRNYPTDAEYNAVREFDQMAKTDLSDVRPDYPFKNNNPAMNVRSAIVEAIDSEKSFLFLGSSGYGGAPPSPYKTQLKEAERIAKQIGQLTGTDYKEIFKMAESTFALGEEGPIGKHTIDKEWETQGGPYYRLDLRPLKQLIDAKLFPGFVGYKKGGLVTKAQGAGYSMNLGDYGRSYT